MKQKVANVYLTEMLSEEKLFKTIEEAIMKKTDLTKIPGIGNNMAEHLIKAGYLDIESLKGQDPEEIYTKDCLMQGTQVDRCVLYCYRLAVHLRMMMVSCHRINKIGGIGKTDLRIDVEFGKGKSGELNI